MNMVQAVVDPQVSRMIEQYDTKHKIKKKVVEAGFEPTTSSCILGGV